MRNQNLPTECILWGKHGSSESMDDDQWHSLLCHMIDVAEVASALWNEVLPEKMRIGLARDLGSGEKETGRCFQFWAAMHDLGKATPGFQGLWEVARTRLKTRGFRFPLEPSTVYHGTATAGLLPKILESYGFDSHLAKQIATAVGGHHGRFPPPLECDLPEAAFTGRWLESQMLLSTELARRTGFQEAAIPSRTPGNPFFILLAGLTSVADWIGSNENLFPWTGMVSDIDGYQGRARSLADKALRSLGWLRWQPSPTAADFGTLFPWIKSPNSLQLSVMDVGPQVSKEPSLVILEAPMGEGKTEAAMYLADLLGASHQYRGCYFALPTQATTNQMFGRIRDFLSGRYPKDIVLLQLLHGCASLSAEFEVLRLNGDRVFTASGIGIDDPSQMSGVVAGSWFTHRKRGLLAPFGVGTIDQALLGVLQSRHVFVRLLGLAHKTVIIDEVHAYDAYMFLGNKNGKPRVTLRDRRTDTLQPSLIGGVSCRLGSFPEDPQAASATTALARRRSSSGSLTGSV